MNSPQLTKLFKDKKIVYRTHIADAPLGYVKNVASQSLKTMLCYLISRFTHCPITSLIMGDKEF